LEQNWILALDANELTLDVAGGKGANLARLARAGFPVPGGFVVTTGAYRAYVAANDLDSFLQAETEALAADDPAALEAVSQAIRARFSAGTLPAELATALAEAYAALGQPPVAVRSSATAEDLPDTSFAGQQDTFLHIVGAEALLAAVVDCWSSLWTARAIGYRARNGLSQDDLALAVVVQAMVESEASGVLFTAEPLSGKRNEMVVEATLGLGEALVSGQVEPDRYRLEVATGRILEQTLGAKALSIRGQASGGTARQTEDAAGRPALPDAALPELARLGREVADLLGAPQDIEWAWARPFDSAQGELYLLQSRPITNLYPLPARMSPEPTSANSVEPLRVMFSFAAVQGILGPMTPLGQDTVRAVFIGAGKIFGFQLQPESQEVLYAAGERLWINLTKLIRNEVGRRVLQGAMPMLEPSIAQALDALWDDPRLAVTGGLRPGGARRIARALLPILPRFFRSLLRPDAERERFQALLEARAAEFEAQMAAAGTLAERLAVAEEILDQAFQFVLPEFLPRFAPAMGPLTLLNRLAQTLPDGPQTVLTLTRGMPHNVTTEMDLVLWATAQRIGADPESAARFSGAEAETLAADYLAGRLPDVAQAAVAAFLARYGARGVGEIDLGRPRWREEPTPVFQALQSYLQIDDPEQAPDATFARGAADAEVAVERLVEGLRATKRGWLKARLARWAVRRVRALAGVRESPKFWAVCMIGLVRAALLDSATDLVEAGVLDRPDDLVFLRLAELEALAAGEGRDWRTLIHQRREAYAREMRRRQVPRVLLSDGQAFYEGVTSPAEAGAGVLAGSPVSPGVVEGVVHVVLDPHGAQLAPGEILVCPGTDPAWTPLFLVAGGLVMEVGGLMTHGSVVAREYGIPAVVGVHQATTQLQTGQRVRVDGTAGRVEVLKQLPDEPKRAIIVS
jgi:phosphohistidine swiveling domain-containing protein